jgi:hypothetical protein
MEIYADLLNKNSRSNVLNVVMRNEANPASCYHISNRLPPECEASSVTTLRPCAVRICNGVSY